VAKEWRLARWARRVAAVVHAASTRRVLGGTSYLLDVGIAAAATIAAVVAAIKAYLPTDGFRMASRGIVLPPGPPNPSEPALHLPHLPPHFAPGVAHLTGAHLSAIPSLAMLGVALTTAPLAFRRTYPTAAFCVILLAVIATNRYATAITIASALFAAYFAVVYGKNRWAALGCLVAGGGIVTFEYPNVGSQVPSRLIPAMVLLATVSLGYLMRMWQHRAGESAARLVRAEAGHVAATRRAVAEERARIAAELHDVVTHNVSVMVVQAGAGRRVLDTSPAVAREAMVAIEASGRTAMTELRHLLGLLAPPAGPELDPSADGVPGVPGGPGVPDAVGAVADHGGLRPQPGLDDIPALVASVRATGLPVELSETGTKRDVPQGPDLAAYRVVQEALTNVIKHAGTARTKVRIDYRARDLLIDVSNAHAAAGGAGPGPAASVGGSGRGLIGLRERIAIYRGTLEVGPRPGGGWRVRATIPQEPAQEPAPASFEGVSA
jgi:signal transduction histidine kinase